MKTLKPQALWGLGIAGIPALISFFFYSPMLQGRLGLIDDHEYLRFLEVGGRNLLNIPAMLATTEVANFGETQRFRPASLTIKAFETVLHGTDGFQWYLWRVGFFVLMIFGLSLLGQKIIQRMTGLSTLWSAALGATFGLALAIAPAWLDIMTRLGPSEFYLAAGLVVLLWGSWYLLARNKDWLGGSLLAVGYALGVGSKENFLTALVPVLLILIIRFLQKGDLLPLALSGLLATSSAIYVALGFLPAISSAGSDVYGLTRSVSGALQVLFQVPQFWITLLASGLAAVIVLQKGSSAASIKVVTALLALSPLLLVGSESYFYQNSFFAGSYSPGRYGIVTELSTIIAVFMLGALGLSIRDRKTSSLKNIAVGVAAVAALVWTPQLTTALGYNAISKSNADFLNAQFSAIEQVSGQIPEGATGQLLYLVDEPYDYERIGATRQYFDWLSGEDPSYYMWTDFTNVEFDQVTFGLAEDLQVWSAEGNEGNKIRPLEELATESPLICVHFGAEPINSPCSQSFWVGG
jgi:hypothetical protein